MKKIKYFLIVLCIFLSIVLFVSCSDNRIKIAIPNDTTNAARALLLLQENGIIKLNENAGILATKADIIENPYNVNIVEMEAAQIPNVLRDVDFAIINSNYAINANMNPIKDSLLIEKNSSEYVNILAVKQGNENSPIIQALVAALNSQNVKDYIDNTYNGAVVYAADTITNGYNEEIDYSALSGTKITVAVSPTPHAQIMNIAKQILSEKNISLIINEYNDYIIPNNIVEDNQVDANYFQHLPYLNDFNAKNNTHLVSAAKIHLEPMGLYGGRQNDLKLLGINND